METITRVIETTDIKIKTDTGIELVKTFNRKIQPGGEAYQAVLDEFDTNFFIVSMCYKTKKFTMPVEVFKKFAGLENFGSEPIGDVVRYDERVTFVSGEYRTPAGTVFLMEHYPMPKPDIKDALDYFKERFGEGVLRLESCSYGELRYFMELKDFCNKAGKTVTLNC